MNQLTRRHSWAMSLFLLCLIAFEVTPVSAQAPSQAPTSKPATTMTAQEFEQRLQALTLQNGRAGAKPTGAEALLMQRLQAQQFATDDSLMAVLNVWMNHESQPKSSDSAAIDPLTRKWSFPESKRLIDQLLTFTYGRPHLAAKLHELKAYISRTEGNPASEVEEYRKVVSLLTPVYLDVDQRRIGSVLLLAQSLEDSGKRDEAENLYSIVSSYPWYAVRDAAASEQLTNFAIEAGKGLIRLNRGNVEALKNMGFLPAFDNILGPLLRAAIAEAELANPASKSQENPQQATPPTK